LLNSNCCAYASASCSIDYFKIDFLHAAAVVGTRVHGDTYSRAQALRAGLEAVRAGIGEDAYLVGCGSPLLSAVGLVDAMRVSEDVAPFYEPRIFFPGFEENTVAGRNAIEPSVLRAPLHRRWFTLDPDCVLLRPTDTELTRNEQVVIRDAALAASGFIALSDDLTLYNTDTWAEATQLFADAERHEGTRSIVDPFATPVEVVTGAGSIFVDWTTPTVERR
jgi:alpha-galactosidase